MRINVLGIGFDNVTMEEAVARGMELIHGEGTHYVVTPNPEIVEVCREWSEVANAVNQADLVLPDGIGILKGAKILGTPLKERVPGIEFAQRLMERMAKKHRSLYLLGAKPHVAELAAERLMARYPGLVVAGVHDGYFREDAPIVEAIRQSGADVVFVCTGAPRQELWMARNGPATGARLLCGLGGSLDIFSGMANRAPQFWCDHGLEWFYRLCKEPWRLGRMRKLPLFLRHVRQEKKERKRQKKLAMQEARRREQREQREQAREERARRREQERLEREERRGIRQREREEERALRQREREAQRVLRQQGREEQRAVQKQENEIHQEEESRRKAQEREARRQARAQRQERRRQEKQAKHPEELAMADQLNHKNTGSGKGNEAYSVQDTRRPPRRKGARLWLRIPAYLLLVAVLSVLLAECGWLLFCDLCAFNREEQKTAVTVEITTADDIKDVAEKLHDAGLINYKFFFRLFAAFAHAEKKIGAGTYELNTEMDYRALIVGMQNASGSMSTPTVRVTIPEGYTVRDIINLLARNGVATVEELTDAAQHAHFDYDFIDNNDDHLARLEGYLFPDTYDFYKPERPVSALNKLLSNFERKLDRWEGELAYAETRGYSLNDIVTVASLIEKETDGTDQGKIASVIYHRLEGPGDRGGTYGLLQIDASLLYALPNHTGPITSEDLATESAYNLYRNAGLPPTPIANPGAKAIEAALTPESTDYYYYGLAKDSRHRFFATYREFTSFLASGEYIGN